MLEISDLIFWLSFPSTFGVKLVLRTARAHRARASDSLPSQNAGQICECLGTRVEADLLKVGFHMHLPFTRRTHNSLDSTVEAYASSNTTRTVLRKRAGRTSNDLHRRKTSLIRSITDREKLRFWPFKPRSCPSWASSIAPRPWSARAPDQEPKRRATSFRIRKTTIRSWLIRNDGKGRRRRSREASRMGSGRAARALKKYCRRIPRQLRERRGLGRVLREGGFPERM